MNGFYGVTGKKIHMLHLRNGEDVLEEIKKYIRYQEIKNGVVISGIGTLSQCSFHGVVKNSLPAKDEFYTLKHVSAELAGMSGIIADGEPHLHMVVTVFGEEYKTYSAHIEPGCKVLCLAEIAILEVESADMMRIKDDDGIYQLTGNTILCHT